jgi:hypothetical protein
MAAISLAQLGHEHGQDVAAIGAEQQHHHQQQFDAAGQAAGMGLPVVLGAEQYMLPMAGLQ